VHPEVLLATFPKPLFLCADQRIPFSGLPICKSSITAGSFPRASLSSSFMKVGFLSFHFSHAMLLSRFFSLSRQLVRPRPTAALLFLHLADSPSAAFCPPPSFGGDSIQPTFPFFASRILSHSNLSRSPSPHTCCTSGLFRDRTSYIFGPPSNGQCARIS